MTTYNVKLAPTGPLTQLPDSQKLFGALIYMFSGKYGGARATELVKSVLHKEIHLALSNVMPFGYLPTPREYLIDRLMDQEELGGRQAAGIGANQTECSKQDQSAGKDGTLKARRAAIKDRHYVKLEQLKALRESPQGDGEVFPYVQLQDQQQLRASIESVRHDIPGLDSLLYSVPTVVSQEVKQEENRDGRKAVTAFHFYLQVDDEALGADIGRTLEEGREARQTVILGKRASQGMNAFEICDLTQEALAENAQSFLNMGMLLPEEIDFAASTFTLHTSERRPFEMAGGWDTKFIRQYISFIAEGSVIVAPAGFKNAGKSIPSPFNARDIVFGNAFLYPLPWNEKGV